MSVDSNHQWLAALTAPRYSGRGSLWVGNAAYLEPLAIDVLGSAWHSRLPGELVWTEQSGDRTLLMRAGLVPGRTAVPSELAVLDGPAEPVWWTDSGVVVLDRQTSTLTKVGSEDETPALAITHFVAGSLSVASVIDAGGQPLLISPDLGVIGPAPWGAECRSGVFSVDFSLRVSVALHCLRPEGGTFEVWGVDEEGTVEQRVVLEVANGIDPGWTSDGGLAYIANPHPLRPSTELIFVRPAGGTVMTVTHPGRVTQIESLQFNVER
jgi:hypothetical protein